MNDHREPTSGCLFTYTMIAAAQALESHMEGALEEVGLSLAKVKLLRHLYTAKEPLALGALAEKSSCVKSNVTQLMDRMEGEGLVRRVADPDDRRSVRAQLTPDGRRRYEQAARLLVAAEEELLGVYPAEERRHFAEMLGRLRGAVPA